MKLFASGFAFRLDELGADGYAADYDQIMSALEKYKLRDRNQRFEWTLPEYKELRLRYLNDFSVSKFVAQDIYKTTPGPRNLFPTGGILEYVFDNAQNEFGNNELLNAWINAHVNEAINQIYNMNLPTIEEFIVLNDGYINEAIELLFSGKNDPEANEHYPVALIAKQRELGRDLTKSERIQIRCRFYKTGDELLMEYKDEFIKEVREEWATFKDSGVANLIKRG